MFSKESRRQRFERRKSKHVRDIRRKDYITNDRDTVPATPSAGPIEYHIMRDADIAPITRGGGWMGGNPRFRNHRQRSKQVA